jgi:glutathione reductase (NADPH)
MEEPMNRFDVLVVGSGTAGQTAALELNAAGLQVAVVEKSDQPGGTCALHGCQPKKWFYEVTEAIAKTRHLTGKGVDAAPQGVWSQTHAQKSDFTSQVPQRTLQGFKDAGITFLRGRAHFLAEDSMEVDGKPVTAGYFVLATGARPMSLPIAGSEHIITSDDFLELKGLPRSILFVGGGFISFEFAHFAARLGPENSHIRILEVSDRPLGQFDAEMVKLLVEASLEEGIEVHTGVQIVSIEKRSSGFHAMTKAGSSFQADLVVHGAGRVPNVEELALETARVDFSTAGIAVDNRMKTSNPRVLAIGDCAASLQLARVADYEGHVAASNILAELTRSATANIDYTAVPALLFTYPQYGMVGKTEAALTQHDIAYRKSFARNLQWPTYKRIGMKHAAYKILVGTDNRVLGAHILSDNASGLINTLRQAMLEGTTADQLYWQNIMTPYPTRESDLIYMLKPFL